jgi:prolyl-tRNA editing enzyme YbaK/EbsC (Cys-tRNA(Pro) deacylase)
MIRIPLSPQDLQTFMTAHQVEGEILQLDMPTPTVEAAAQAAGVRPEQIVKSILFRVEDPFTAQGFQPVLAIACGTAYVERRAIAAYYGVGRKRVKLASPEEVLAISGYEVGAMPPFGHRQPLPTLLDRRVLDLTQVYAGGGAENALVRLDPRDITRLSAAVVMDLSAVPEADKD